jgi:hypothetical protein
MLDFLFAITVLFFFGICALLDYADVIAFEKSMLALILYFVLSAYIELYDMLKDIKRKLSSLKEDE